MVRLVDGGAICAADGCTDFEFNSPLLLTPSAHVDSFEHDAHLPPDRICSLCTARAAFFARAPDSAARRSEISTAFGSLLTFGSLRICLARSALSVTPNRESGPLVVPSPWSTAELPRPLTSHRQTKRTSRRRVPSECACRLLSLGDVERRRTPLETLRRWRLLQDEKVRTTPQQQWTP